MGVSVSVEKLPFSSTLEIGWTSSGDVEILRRVGSFPTVSIVWNSFNVPGLFFAPDGELNNGDSNNLTFSITLVLPPVVTGVFMGLPAETLPCSLLNGFELMVSFGSPHEVFVDADPRLVVFFSFGDHEAFVVVPADVAILSREALCNLAEESDIAFKLPRDCDVRLLDFFSKRLIRSTISIFDSVGGRVDLGFTVELPEYLFTTGGEICADSTWAKDEDDRSLLASVQAF
jgi:hypothetical protein